jgi:hypothetical protein
VASSKHHEETIILGEKGFKGAITKIESRMSTLQEIISSAEESIERLQQHVADGIRDPDRITSMLQREWDKVTLSTQDMEQLNNFNTHPRTPRWTGNTTRSALPKRDGPWEVLEVRGNTQTPSQGRGGFYSSVQSFFVF